MCALLQLLMAALLALALVRGSLANTCYYPDGSTSDKDQSCVGTSNAAAACCPEGWQCLDGGFCYLDYANYISRYTCTDRSWDSNACPKYCLNGSPNGTDTGNVALLNCGGDKYCCNGDRSGNCCKDKAVSYFTMESELPAPPSSSIDPPPPPATSSPSGTVYSTTVDIPASSLDPPSKSTENTSTPSPIIVTSVVSNSNNGAPSTVYLTKTATPTATSPTNNDSSSSSKSVVIGCAVGIPLSAILIGLFAFLLWRQRRRNNKGIPNNRCNNLLPPFLSAIPEENEKTPRVSELDGYPRAAGGGIAPPPPASTTNNRTSNISEYYSSSTAKGGSGGGGKHARNASEADGTPIIGASREKPSPAELESPRSAHKPAVELEANEAVVGTGRSGGFFRGPTSTVAAIAGAATRLSAGGGGNSRKETNLAPAPPPPPPKTEGQQGSGSPDLGRGYAVGGVGGGLRIVNAVEGELDSEVEDRDGGESGSGRVEASKKKVENPSSSASSPPPVYQSPRTWGQQWRGAATTNSNRSSVPGAVAGAAPDGIGSPVSPLQGHGWGR